VHQAEATEAHLPRTGAPDVGELQLVSISDDDPFDLALPVEEHADLPVRLQRELRQVPGQLGADDLVRGDPTAVGVAELVEFAGLEAEGVPVQVFQMRSPGQPGAAAGEDLAIFGLVRSGTSQRAGAGRP
jgi:hypothetical protein